MAYIFSESLPTLICPVFDTTHNLKQFSQFSHNIRAKLTEFAKNLIDFAL